MQSSSDHSVSGLSVSSQLGLLTQQMGSMTRAAAAADHKVTLGSMSPLLYYYPTKNATVGGEEEEEDHDSGRPRRESPTSSTASLESIDDDWEYYETLHPIQEVILNKQAPLFAVEPTASMAVDKRNVWMDHLVALVGTLVFCALLFASRVLQK